MVGGLIHGRAIGASNARLARRWVSHGDRLDAAGETTELEWRHISIWADAHANLPTWARWIAKADAAPSGATKRATASALLFRRAFLFPDSVIDAGLIQAFREIHYQVHGAEPFTLRMDEHSAALAAAHKRFRSDCCAFITACNPFSEGVDAASNAQLHADLGLELARRSLAHIEGIGQHPSNQWPGDASYLVFGLKLEAAKTLGRALKQNAIVWSDADAVPRLILLR
jgi:hypothetical protein